MSDKYKIRINQEAPSDAEISKSKDFEALLIKTQTAYKPLEMRKKMHRKRNLIMLVVSVLAVALALYFGK